MTRARSRLAKTALTGLMATALLFGAVESAAAAESLKQPQPEVHLRADQSVAYRVVAQTLADASRAGLTRIGFVSEPEAAR